MHAIGATGWLSASIVFVLLAIALNYRHRPKNSYILLLLYSLPFMAASIESLGILTIDQIKYACEAIIVALFGYLLLKKKKSVRLIGYIYIALFIVVVIISTVINRTSIIKCLLFLRITLIPVLFFWYVVNDFNINDFISMDMLVNALLISQIPASIVKFIMIGTAEPYIGTISILGGSTTLIVALLGVTIATYEYLVKRKAKYIFIFLGYVAFVSIGEKRAGIVLIPAVSVFIYFLIMSKIKLAIILKRLPIYLLIVAVSIYAIGSIIPSLNPDRKVGGKFDLNYFTNWVNRYLFPSYPIKGSYYHGRGQAPIGFYNLMKSSEESNILFGYGPGELVTSRYLDYGLPWVKSSEDLMLYKFDVGYGGRTGFIWLGLQLGLFGSLILIMFYLRLFVEIFKLYKKRLYPSKSLVCALVFFTIFFIDYFTYSKTLFERHAVIIPFLSYIAWAYKEIQVNNYAPFSHTEKGK